MSKLIITRTSEWNNRARKFGIYIDNKKIGTISNGETKEFNIDSGKHKINGKIDWCRSPIMEFEITENESKIIEIGGFKNSKIIMPLGIVIMSLFFLIKYLLKIESNFLILFAGIGFLFPFYYMTIGKNKYLTIREK
ncbi:hypothetical protein [Polaribacter sp. AHE13PA]|uniref:hypothetical protein n=1 Tax=Polaribacter sp. AHE13PA TaxID=2745562 RepID=UPI001C501BFA|nr:hypothetical protein [Polaribacter sp. AHE13PA]QXP65750.1 hypothetical protein H0I28_11125 [Polaribacter sp. AHE13PA]